MNADKDAIPSGTYVGLVQGANTSTDLI